MSDANLDPANIGSIFACNNGNGPTVYYGRVPNTNHTKDPGFVVVRTDIGNTNRVMFEHGDRANTAMFIRVQDVELEVNGASTPSPAPTAILRNVNTGEVIDTSGSAVALAASAPLQMWTGMSGPSGASAETTVIDPSSGASIGLVQDATAAAATSAAIIAQNGCGTFYGERNECLALATGDWIVNAGWGLSIFGLYRTLTAATVAAVDVIAGVGGLALMAAPSARCLDQISIDVRNCFMPDCTNGRCDLFGQGCIELRPEWGGGQQLCDLSCQTCQLSAPGEPYCSGLQITGLDYSADVPTSGSCSTPTIWRDLTIHYCGRTNGYTAATWGVKVDGCPAGWNCPISLSQFFPQATTPATLKNALGCCSNGGTLPATFNSICDVFDRFNVDFADFDWRCVD
jgi:hypothetical protein